MLQQQGEIRGVDDFVEVKVCPARRRLLARPPLGEDDREISTGDHPVTVVVVMRHVGTTTRGGRNGATGTRSCRRGSATSRPGPVRCGAVRSDPQQVRSLGVFSDRRMHSAIEPTASVHGNSRIEIASDSGGHQESSSTSFNPHFS